MLQNIWLHNTLRFAQQTLEEYKRSLKLDRNLYDVEEV